MVRQHLWKIFEFTGWFVLLLGVIFGLLYSSIVFGTPIQGALFLAVLGTILALLGEFLLSQFKEHAYRLIFQAFSVGGAFSLTIGIIWFAIQLLQSYQNQSWVAVTLMLVIGVGLIVLGESVKIEE